MDIIWTNLIAQQMKEPFMQELHAFITEERKIKKIYPASSNTFRAFDACPYKKLRVVIIGQDPYHTPLAAHGLAFSSQAAQTPPSLQVIFNEIRADYFKGESDYHLFKSNNLTEWAEQGVLLLNSILTVEEGKAGSHRNRGWEKFCKQVVTFISDSYPQPLVFMLWGEHAQSFGQFINHKVHLVLRAAHPAAELQKKDAGFLGCRHFSQANSYIQTSRKWNIQGNNLPVNWGVFNK